jgi:putative ABC transport system permease protein
LLVELILLALLAGGLGLILGFFLAGALLPDVAATLRGLYGAPVEGGLTLRPLWILSGLGMALAGTFMAGGQALWRVARLPLLSAPGVQSWSARARSGHRWQALAGGGLAVVGVLSVLLFDGLLAGFALLAGIMLGTALALPVVLSLPLSLLQRSPWPAGRMGLVRHARAVAGPVAGADGIAAGHCRKHRRRHHGLQLSPDLSGLDGSAPLGRALCDRAQ